MYLTFMSGGFTVSSLYVSRECLPLALCTYCTVRGYVSASIRSRFRFDPFDARSDAALRTGFCVGKWFYRELGRPVDVYYM